MIELLSTEKGLEFMEEMINDDGTVFKGQVQERNKS